MAHGHGQYTHDHNIIYAGSLDSMERGMVEWNSGTIEWNSGMVERWNTGIMVE